MSAILTEPLYHAELIDGVEVAKPLPKKLHAVIQSYVIRTLGSRVSASYQVLSELNVLCGVDRLVPDVTIAYRNAHYVDGDLADPAVFAVEIMSPGQTLSNIVDKAERICRAGAPLCWIIWPERRQSWILSQERFIEARNPLQVPLSEAEHIEVDLEEMWAELD
jgi:Uma2 family endonuclease